MRPALILALFAILFRPGPGWDGAKPPQQQVGFAGHSKNLAALRAEGRIVLGGRYGDVGLIVVEAADEAEVRVWLARDPTLPAKVFTADVKRWATIYDGCVAR
jgi:uncharacterized protein YciI